MRRLAARQIAAKRTELLSEMEQALAEELHRAAVTDVHEVRRVLGSALRRAARTVVLRMLRACRGSGVPLPSGARGTRLRVASRRRTGAALRLPAAVQEAAPQRFSTCGGQQRLLVVASEALSSAITPAALGDEAAAPPTVIVDPQADMLICHEIEDLPLKRIASVVLDQRFHAVQAASRLHTRTDVPWTPL